MAVCPQAILCLGKELTWVFQDHCSATTERVTRAYTVEVQTASVFYAQSLILLLFRSIDPLLSLEAVKHGHTISAVGVDPCTGRLYFSGGRGGGVD